MRYAISLLVFMMLQNTAFAQQSVDLEALTEELQDIQISHPNVSAAYNTLQNSCFSWQAEYQVDGPLVFERDILSPCVRCILIVAGIIEVENGHPFVVDANTLLEGAQRMRCLDYSRECLDKRGPYFCSVNERKFDHCMGDLDDEPEDQPTELSDCSLLCR